MIPAPLLYAEAAEVASHAISRRDEYPHRLCEPLSSDRMLLHLDFAVALLEWAGEDHQTHAVTVAIGQCVRLARGGARNRPWNEMLEDVVDVCRDSAGDLEFMGDPVMLYTGDMSAVVVRQDAGGVDAPFRGIAAFASRDEAVGYAAVVANIEADSFGRQPTAHAVDIYSGDTIA